MKKTQRLNTIDGKELLELDVNPPEYVISQIMPNGLHLLAVSPKVGKSWLVLWMCDCIAKGKKIWEFDTYKSTVLYLSLEDNLNRLYFRLACITEQSTKDVKFTTKAPSLGEGLRKIPWQGKNSDGDIAYLLMYEPEKVSHLDG